MAQFNNSIELVHRVNSVPALGGKEVLQIGCYDKGASSSSFTFVVRGD
jgi:hypothetical protein